MAAVDAKPESLVRVDWSRGQICLAPAAVQGREELQTLCQCLELQLRQLEQAATDSNKRLAAAVSLH